MLNRTSVSRFRPLPEAQDERNITIPKNMNATSVQVNNHRWVAICRGNEEIMRDESPGGMVNFQLPPGEYVVRTDGKIDTVSFETVERPTFPGRPAGMVSVLDQLLMEGKPIGTLRPRAGLLTLPMLPSTEEPTPTEIDLDALPAVFDVSVEAPGRSPVDGMPEVPADGKAFCTISLSKMTVTGQALNRANDTDEIYLRATGGRLVNARGKLQHKLQLNKGKASFRLVSETTPRLVTVSILSPTLQKIDVHIDFVPAG